MTRAIAILAGLLLLAPGSVPAGADPEGCIAVGMFAGQVGPFRPAECFYVASGPGRYVASTTNPFVIAVQTGTEWRVIAGRTTFGPPASGLLPTQSGQRVSVSIGCWDYAANASCAENGRIGVVVAQSDL